MIQLSISSLRQSVGVFNKYPTLVNSFKITSLGVDDDLKEFTNSFEGTNVIPIYAVQYHPEENSYDRQETLQLEHNAEARRVSQFLTLFFISEARKNKHIMNDNEKKKYDYFTSFSSLNVDRYEDHV